MNYQAFISAFAQADTTDAMCHMLAGQQAPWSHRSISAADAICSARRAAAADGRHVEQVLPLSMQLLKRLTHCMPR
jgi:hypothetical protein